MLQRQTTLYSKDINITDVCFKFHKQLIANLLPPPQPHQQQQRHRLRLYDVYHTYLIILRSSHRKPGFVYTILLLRCPTGRMQICSRTSIGLLSGGCLLSSRTSLVLRSVSSVQARHPLFGRQRVGRLGAFALASDRHFYNDRFQHLPGRSSLGGLADHSVLSSSGR